VRRGREGERERGREGKRERGREREREREGGGEGEREKCRRCTAALTRKLLAPCSSFDFRVVSKRCHMLPIVTFRSSSLFATRNFAALELAV
jgi:hypothetical protein